MKKVFIVKIADTAENFGVYSTIQKANALVDTHPQGKHMIIVEVELNREVSF